MFVWRHFQRRIGLAALPILALMAALSALLACARPAGEENGSVAGDHPAFANSLKDFNLIIVNIDALRRDHLSCYGYARETTPFIDRLAKEGVLFEDAMANSSWTMESVTTLMTGLLPSANAELLAGALPSTRTMNLAPLLQQAGYYSGLFSNNLALEHESFYEGFDEVAFWDIETQTGAELSARAAEFIEEHGEGKFLLYLHYLDPHGPYDPPDDKYLLYADDVHPEPVHIYEYLRDNLSKEIAAGFGPGENRFEDFVRRYDAEIRETDEAVKQLFQTLKEHGLEEKTLVLITADHGEEFLDHGFIDHGWTVYNESLEIPLIFWAPGKLPARHCAERVSTVDLLPTLLELLAIPHQREFFNGESLFKRQGEEFVFQPPAKPFIAELQMEYRMVLRTVIKDDWKYIQARKWLTPLGCEEVSRNVGKLIEMYRTGELPHVDIWGFVEHEELYNLADDPDERNNLLALDPAAQRPPTAIEFTKQEALGEEFRLFKDVCRELGEEAGGAYSPSRATARVEKPDAEKIMQSLKDGGYLFRSIRKKHR